MRSTPLKYLVVAIKIRNSLKISNFKTQIKVPIINKSTKVRFQMTLEVSNFVIARISFGNKLHSLGAVASKAISLRAKLDLF